ncbi:MAG TPA: cyclic nucleotide-binding domain-containing protein [Stenomitos sp.]
MELVRFPGATYLAAGNRRILFGTFPEIHQHLMKRGLAWPDTVVFTDALVRDRLPQMVPEFLFFGHVFFNQNFDFATLSIKKPLTFLGTESQVQRAYRIMDVSYLGTVPELMARDLDPERAAMLDRECHYYALKNKAGEIIPTREYLELKTWDEADTAWLDDVKVMRTGMLCYRVEHAGEVAEIDLSDHGLQGPAWTIPEVTELHSAPQYAVRILGAAGAFQHVSPSTSYLMTLNGEHYLIDCSPYVHRTLEYFGVAVDQVKGILVSHIHDDHTGDLLTFALSNTKPELLTTREVWESLKIKLSCILDCDESVIEGYFRFREVLPEEPVYLGGARLDFHDACHSVPCVGVTVTVGDEELVITSDTSGHRQLLDMLGKGVICQERFDSLEALLGGQKVIVDCGEAIIHGFIQDFLHLEDHSNLVLAHRHTLPEEYREVFDLAQPLQVFEFSTRNEDVLNMVQIGRSVEGWHLSDLWGWTGQFATQGEIREPMMGEVVIRQGSKAEDDYFYVISHGFFDVLVDNTKVAQLKTGDYFGEQAFVQPNGMRSASVVATSPARLVAIPGTVFKAMLQEEDRKARLDGREPLTARLLRLWENREVLAKAKVFAGLDTQALNAFSLRLERVQVGPSQVVIEQGAQDDSACYLVMQGSLQVENPDRPETHILRENDLFGEGVAAGFTGTRSATVRALEPCTLLKLSHLDLQVIGSEHPHVLFALRDLVAERQYLPAV